MPRERTYTRTGQQTVLPLAARTGTGASEPMTNWLAAATTGGTPQARLTITAVSGTTPSLTVVVEDSPDGSTWTVRDTFPAQTGAGAVTRALPTSLVAHQRVRWTITGSATPTFTFSVQFASSASQLL